ncbi:MAG: hypothetical protein GWO10_03025 [candidate division Zixibacteria bacterium]|nr:hypothetical protein [candidate division Zixibacteria bacterium]
MRVHAGEWIGGETALRRMFSEAREGAAVPNITITVTGNTIAKEIDVKKLAERIGRHVGSRLMSRGFWNVRY